MADKEISVACRNCGFTTTNEKELLSHSRIHQHEINYGIQCFRCPTVSTKYNAHQKHIKTCTEKFKRREKLPEKWLEKTPEKTESNPIQHENEFNWQCPYDTCDFNLDISANANLQDFNKIQTHCYVHKDNMPPCFVCGKKYEVRIFKYLLSVPKKLS